MTMAFRTVKQALEDLLVANAGTGFKVVGHQRAITNIEQYQDGDTSGDGNRTLQVFSAAGDFPKNRAAGMSGPVTHEMTYRIELFVSRGTEGNLAALDAATDPTSRAAAAATFTSAARLVDNSFDEFVDLVYQILMDPQNRNLGLPWSGNTIISDRWLSGWTKDSVVGDGEIVGITGLMTLNLTVVEDINGDAIATPMTEGIDMSVSVNTDPTIGKTDETAPVAGNILAKA